jgi:serine protease AprX
VNPTQLRRTRWPARLVAAATSVAATIAWVAVAPTTPAMAADAAGNILNQLERFNATGLASQGVDGRGVGIAMIDTGVVNVPGLPAAQIVNGPDLSVESQSPALRYLDTNGHGTAMASIIVGNDPATGYRGVAPKAKLTSIKVGAADGSVDVTQVIAAIDWAVAHRFDDPANPIRVISLAYGTDGKQDYAKDPLDMAVENAWRVGISVVVAAGNTGAGLTLQKPADDPFMISVGSSNNYRMSAFSTSAGWRNIDVVVPAEKVISLRNQGSFLDQTYPGARIGTTLFRGSGTSQASALVSGAIALLLQKRPLMSNDQVKELLIRSGDWLWGAGLASAINLPRAMATAPALFAPQFWWQSNGRGSFQASRGTSAMTDSGVALTGERDIFGPLSAATWAAASFTGTAWVGGKWMGRTVAGNGWTGTSWASRTWAPATWTGTSWSGKAWVSTDWSGRYWSGRYWSGGAWSGRYWSGRYWSGNNWATALWG